MTSGQSAGLGSAVSRLALGVIALAGTGVGGYLTYSHYADQPTVCGVGRCEVVQTSAYSELAGVPVALLGLLYFAGFLLLALGRWGSVRSAVETAQPAVLSAALAGTAFVAYLTYVELFVLDAICVWCVSLASLTAASLAVVVWDVLREARAQE